MINRIAVLIPCFNESNTIGKVVSDFRRALPEATIYVYDNNSTDGTAGIASDAGAIVRMERSQGKGNVIRRMFREIEADCYIMTDGDDTYPAEYAPEMARLVLEEQADMVIGDRLSSTYFTENRRPFHNAGNSLVRACINRLFQSHIQDIMTGYRAFSYAFVKTYPVLASGFEIETDMTIHAINRRMRVENVVINYRDRPKGSISKLNTFSDGTRVLMTILRMFKSYRPFAFFGSLAFILAVISMIFVIPVLAEYFDTGRVPRYPTLFVCGFSMLAALLLFSVGLMLSTLQEKDKRDFEIDLIAVQERYRSLKEGTSSNSPIDVE